MMKTSHLRRNPVLGEMISKTLARTSAMVGTMAPVRNSRTSICGMQQGALQDRPPGLGPLCRWIFIGICAVLLVPATATTNSRLLGMSLLEHKNSNGSLDELRQTTKELARWGVNLFGMAPEWAELEPAPRRWNLAEPLLHPLDWLDPAGEVFQSYLLVIKTIDTHRKTVPADLRDFSFDHPETLARFQALLEELSRHPSLHKVSHLLIGNEVDGYLAAHPGEIPAFVGFFQQVAPLARALLPQTKVGTIVTFASLHTAPTILESLLPACDFIGYTYYPTGDGWRMRSVDEVPADLELMAARAGTKPFALTETGSTSSLAHHSSETEQARFVQVLFRTLQPYWAAGRLEFLFYHGLYDYPPDFCQTYAEAQGIPAGELCGFMNHLGLHSHETAQPKPAWDAFINLALGGKNAIDQFVRRDVRLGDPLVSYGSTEFTPDWNYLVWGEYSTDGSDHIVVWHCQVNRDTGDLIPADGKGFRAFESTGWGRASPGRDAFGVFYVGMNRAGRLVLVRPTSATEGTVEVLPAPVDFTRRGIYATDLPAVPGSTGYVFWIKNASVVGGPGDPRNAWVELRYLSLANPSEEIVLQHQNRPPVANAFAPLDIAFPRCLRGSAKVTSGVRDPNGHVQVVEFDLTDPFPTPRSVTIDAVTKSDAFPWTLGEVDILMSGTEFAVGSINVYTRPVGTQYFQYVETIVPQVDTLEPPVFAQSNERVAMGGLPFTAFQVNRTTENFFDTTFAQTGEIWLSTLLQTPQRQWRLSEDADTAKFEDETFLGHSQVWVFYSAIPRGAELRRTIVQLRRCDTPIRAPSAAEIVPQADGGLFLRWSGGYPQTRWMVQRSSDLHNWNDLEQALEVEAGVFTHTGSQPDTPGFYRLREAD